MIFLLEKNILLSHFSGAPRAPKARARGALYLRKYGNPSKPAIDVRKLWFHSHDVMNVHTYVRTYVRPPFMYANVTSKYT